jgi:uncharacterized 2Fe-2S/4Fe-4S cluster protein (DUF4445 family)
MSPILKILPDGIDLAAIEGEGLDDALAKAGIPLSLYCGGRGLCGKCFVEIVRGTLPEAGEDERALAARRRLAPHFRLACRVRIAGDLAVRIPASSLLPRMPVLSQGVERSFALDPAVRKIRLAIPSPALTEPQALFDLVRARFPGEGLTASPDALRSLVRAWAEGGGPAGEITVVLHGGRELLAVEPGDTADRAFGLALDLGTTTVAAELVDLVAGRVMATATALNAQVKFGADVMSRITAAFGDPARAEELRRVLLDSLNALIGSLCESSGVAGREIYEAVVAGNTAMNHLFLGLPVDTLAVAPYFAVFSSIAPVQASESGLKISSTGKVIVAPNLKSFVGGDISAGLAAIDAVHRPGNFLFIDLGTNGELVLKNGSKFTATSTAAGPAFEGMAISCGMLAVPGAVFKAADGKGTAVAVETVGGEPPQGVCGTGLIDLVALALRRGLVSPQGQIRDPSKAIPVADGIVLTQKDIREVQLAAAAVKTGIRMLLEAEGLSIPDLDEVYVAGAFGSYLDLGNAMALGLLPLVAREKIRFIGNSSLAGARAMLLSMAERERCEALAGRIGHESLARGSAFQSLFVDALEFREWS